MRVVPLKGEDDVIVRYCFECKWRHMINVQSETFVEGQSTEYSPKDVSPDYIKKPFGMQELLAAVHELV